MDTTVWFDSARTSFWLVPQEHALPDGPTLIMALSGRRRSVERAALDPFELPRERVRHEVFAELVHAARHTGRAVGTVTHDVLSQASTQIPAHLSWEELERRFGPMTTWSPTAQSVHERAEQVRASVQRAGQTVARTGRIAASTARSARDLGKFVADNPEIVHTASRVASTLVRLSRSRSSDQDEPDKS